MQGKKPLKQVAQPVNVTVSLNGFSWRKRDEEGYSLYLVM